MNELFVTTNQIFLFIYRFIVIGTTIRIVTKSCSPSKTIIWLLTIYTFPTVGIFFYLLFGEKKIDKNRLGISRKFWIDLNKYRKKFIHEEKNFFSKKNSETAIEIFKFCRNKQNLEGIKFENIRLLENSRLILKNLIKDINSAKKSIEIIFYIWKKDGLVKRVIKSIIAASNRGVKCRLVLDSFGSIDFFRSKESKIMIDSGIKIVRSWKINFFRFFSCRFDLRQHRKMVLIDNHITYTGSMNMVDPKFFKKNLRIGEWIDIMVRIEGPVTVLMKSIFLLDWAMETREKPLFPSILRKSTSFDQKETNNSSIQVIASGPGFPKDFIHQSLLISIYSAKKTLVITTPYLILSKDLLNAICIASYRGVDVKIIIPRYNNSIFVEWASKTFFSDLLEAGVTICRFSGGLLHTKSISIDEQVSIIGTANLDMRSLWLNFEVLLIIDDSGFNRKLSYIQRSYISKSIILDRKDWMSRPYWKKIIENFFCFFNPLL